METTEFIGTRTDLVVIFAYFLAIVGFGLYFGRYTRNTKDFFFGGQRFAWWLIAFSCVATTVGSYSFQKYSKVGFDYGLSSSQTYLNDWFWMGILLLVWLPIIYYQRLGSIPEYFERRFGSMARMAATAIILLYIIAYIGINIFTVGKVLNALLGWSVLASAIITTVLVTLYVFVGGQTSVIMTDLAQGIILLIAGIGVFLAGIAHFGGFADFWALLPQGHRFAFSEFSAPDKFSFIGIFAQDGLCNTGAFMLMNQGIVLRFMSLRSVHDARKMAVCWVLVLAPLAAIATSGAGWIGRALVANGELDMDSSEAFVQTAWFLCAPGIFGFVLAALTAALMSTADTLINAVSAVFVNDIWRRFIRPNGTEVQRLKVARIMSLVAAALGLALVPIYYYQYESIYQAHAVVTGSIPAPMVVAILLGILWKRYTPKAAVATLVGGLVVIGISFIPPFDRWLIGPFSFGMGRSSYGFMRALYGLTACGVIGVVVSLFTKPKPLAEITGLVTGTQLDAMRVYKGGEPNRLPGKKARIRVEADATLSDAETAVVPRRALERMAANPGDILYVSDPRWWFGGLRSVHVRAGQTAEDDVLRIHPDALADAHLDDGQEAIIEKII
ncbi:MAG: sodium/solute symporter [Candidatus Hydrogenedentota bacterium]